MSTNLKFLLISESAGFDWDDANFGHFSHRGISQSEWEDAFLDPSRTSAAADPGHFAFDATTSGGRRIRIVYYQNSDGSIRPVTAHQID
jgi:hypothetical protein